MTIQKILVPDMGDFKDVEVIEVLVKKGQDIKKNDSLITLESDKSSVEVPSTHEGKVEKINVSVGDKINKGDIIGTVGSTGRSTGPHLDFRVNWFQTRLDPMTIFKIK